MGTMSLMSWRVQPSTAQMLSMMCESTLSMKSGSNARRSSSESNSHMASWSYGRMTMGSCLTCSA